MKRDETYLSWLRQQAQKFEERAEEERGNTMAMCEARMNAYRDAAAEYMVRTVKDDKETTD